MWPRVIEFGKKIFSLSQRVEKLEEKSETLSADVAKLNERIDRLSDAITALVFEVQRQRDQATHDRELSSRDLELLRVKLENALLRAERGQLPSPAED